MVAAWLRQYRRPQVVGTCIMRLHRVRVAKCVKTAVACRRRRFDSATRNIHAPPVFCSLSRTFLPIVPLLLSSCSLPLSFPLPLHLYLYTVSFLRPQHLYDGKHCGLSITFRILLNLPFRSALSSSSSQWTAGYGEGEKEMRALETVIVSCGWVS